MKLKKDNILAYPAPYNQTRRPFGRLRKHLIPRQLVVAEFLLLQRDPLRLVREHFLPASVLLALCALDGCTCCGGRDEFYQKEMD